MMILLIKSLIPYM
jgi:hypothetical protein